MSLLKTKQTINTENRSEHVPAFRHSFKTLLEFRDPLGYLAVGLSNLRFSAREVSEFYCPIKKKRENKRLFQTYRASRGISAEYVTLPSNLNENY